MVSVVAVRSPVVCLQGRSSVKQAGKRAPMSRALPRVMAHKTEPPKVEAPKVDAPAPQGNEPPPPPQKESLCSRLSNLVPPMPQLQLPEFKLPEFNLPQLQLPQLQLPQLQLPELQLPQCPNAEKNKNKSVEPPAEPVVIKLPKRLHDRFALALQAQCLPWAESEATLRALWHEDCTFRDPVMNVKSREQFISYLAMMDKFGKTLRVDVEHFNLKGNVGMATGKLYYKVTGGPDMVVDYSTCMIFKNGRIIEHRDYWDVIGTVASTILGKGKLPE